MAKTILQKEYKMKKLNVIVIKIILNYYLKDKFGMADNGPLNGILLNIMLQECES